MMRRAIKGLAVGSGVVAAAFVPIVLVMTLVGPVTSAAGQRHPWLVYDAATCTATVTASGIGVDWEAWQEGDVEMGYGHLPSGQVLQFVFSGEFYVSVRVEKPNGTVHTDSRAGVANCAPPETTTTTTTSLPPPGADVQASVDCDALTVTNQGAQPVTLEVGVGAEASTIITLRPGGTRKFQRAAGYSWGILNVDTGGMLAQGGWPEECNGYNPTVTTTTTTTLPPEDPESSTTTTSPPAVDDVTPPSTTIPPRSVSERDAEPCGPGLTGDGVGGCWAIVEGG